MVDRAERLDRTLADLDSELATSVTDERSDTGSSSDKGVPEAEVADESGAVVVTDGRLERGAESS